MPVRPVVALPDPRLKQVSAPVGEVDEAARALAVDLLDTMRAMPACVGLAAPQIGVSRRAFAVDVTGAGAVVVRGTTPEGTERIMEVDAFEARAVLHEIDHLDGLLFLDRVS